MALCMSPLGAEFSARLRKFPSLVSNCTVDYFAPWPEEALRSVAFTALDGIDLGTDAVKEGIVTTCGIIHQSVEDRLGRLAERQRPRRALRVRRGGLRAGHRPQDGLKTMQTSYFLLRASTGCTRRCCARFCCRACTPSTRCPSAASSHASPATSRR